MKIKRNSVLCLLVFIISCYILLQNINNVLVVSITTFVLLVSIILLETFLIIDNERA